MCVCVCVCLFLCRQLLTPHRLNLTCACYNSGSEKLNSVHLYEQCSTHGAINGFYHKFVCNFNCCWYQLCCVLCAYGRPRYKKETCSVKTDYRTVRFKHLLFQSSVCLCYTADQFNDFEQIVNFIEETGLFSMHSFILHAICVGFGCVCVGSVCIFW